MKKRIIIGISIFIMVAIISFVFFVVVSMERSSSILDKEIQTQKLMIADSTAKAKADSIALTSCKEKQVYAFSKLVKKLKENSFTFSLIKVELANGSDPIGMEKPPATIEQLSKWTSFDFIVLSFPNSFIDLIGGKIGILSISCNNYDKKNPEFVAAINTERETSYGYSMRSIPYFMAETGKESISEIEEQKYVLEAIERALHAIEITVACDRVLSSLIQMEQEEKLGHKPPSVIITTEDTIQ